MTTYSIETQNTVRHRTYKGLVVLSSVECLLPQQCWTTEQWAALESKSKLQPLEQQKIKSYANLVREALLVPEIRTILSFKNEQVTRAVIRKLFILIEDLIDMKDIEDSTKSKLSDGFRSVVISCAKDQQLSEDISRITVRFQSRLVLRNSPRKLISDSVGNYDDEDLNTPVSALSHTNIFELIKKTEKRVEVDLESIRLACITELKACADLRILIDSIGKDENRFCKQDYENIEKIVINGETANGRIIRWKSTHSARNIISLYRKFIVSHNIASVDNCKGYCFWDANNLLRSIAPANVSDLLTSRKSHALFMPERALSAELIAAFVLLLTYTGWNSSSLMCVEADKIIFKDGYVEIQGFKNKTNDHTPICILDSNSPYAEEAIKFLLWNRAQLIKLGYIREDEQKLWFGWSNKSGPLQHQIVGFQHLLKNLQIRYKLPMFSIEQVRAQKLAHEALKTNDPEIVRRIAGHQSLSTTGHYLDQLIFSRINEAINLEFQRRLENTVLFRLGKETNALNDKVNLRHIDLHLLVPIGDGSSCLDPMSPPFEHYLDGALCSGMSCHVNGGCENRKIVIDKDRLEELVRKRDYYLRNWQRLYSNNPEAFEAYHIHAILFTFGLFDYVVASKYRKLITQIKKDIDNEYS